MVGCSGAGLLARKIQALIGQGKTSYQRGTLFFYLVIIIQM